MSPQLYALCLYVTLPLVKLGQVSFCISFTHSPLFVWPSAPLKPPFHICIYIQASLHTHTHTLSLSLSLSQSFRISPGFCFTIERNQWRRAVSYPELGSPTAPSFQNIVKDQELREADPQREKTTPDSQEDASGPYSQLLSLTLQVVLKILMLICPAYMGFRSRKRRERERLLEAKAPRAIENHS